MSLYPIGLETFERLKIAAKQIEKEGELGLVEAKALLRGLLEHMEADGALMFPEDEADEYIKIILKGIQS